MIEGEYLYDAHTNRAEGPLVQPGDTVKQCGCGHAQIVSDPGKGYVSWRCEGCGRQNSEIEVEVWSRGALAVLTPRMSRSDVNRDRAIIDSDYYGHP